MRSLLFRFLLGKTSSARAANPRKPGRRAAVHVEPLERRLALAGFEIAYLGNLGPDYTGPTQVYLAGGTKPMTAAAWDAYVPPDGYIKNTTRNVEFESQEVLTSPDSATGETYITTDDGYTWLFVAETVSANWPFDPSDYTTPYASGYQAAALSTTPPAGVVKYSANTKNANVTWRAKDAAGQPIERYFIRDAWGSLYIMQTSGATDQADVRSNFFSAVLPAGWTMFAGALRQDLTTSPAYDSAGFAQFNIFRNSADDAFQQITWGSRGKSIAQQIPGMVIWGGTTSDTLIARRGQDNLIHGAQGNDWIIALGINDRIHGDHGNDTVVFRGSRSDYIVTPLTADGTRVEVRTRLGGERARVATLFDVERLQFQDRVVRTADLGRILWLKWLVFSPSQPQAVGPSGRLMSGVPRRPATT